MEKEQHNKENQSTDPQAGDMLITHEQFVEALKIVNGYKEQFVKLAKKKERYNQEDVVPSAITYEQFLEVLKIVKGYKNQIVELANKANGVTQEVREISSYFYRCNPETSINEIGFSVRLYNILKSNQEKHGIKIDHSTKAKDLEALSMSKFLGCRNAGKKTLDELKEFAFYAGIKLSK
jgi:DNA-directed RNA polymerase alpha subunit